MVWRATDKVLSREVAVKEVMFPPTTSQEDRSAMQARVLREARAAARLSGPGVVTVFDVLQDEDHAYIVMELVEAPSLAELVRRRGPLSPIRTAQIGRQVLRVLEAAHEKGIVHRDVKPGNVIVRQDGHVKLADFGIARLKDDTNITSTGLVLGSPSYMAPEQAKGLSSGPSADLWGLGATMYFAVEGRPPFDKEQAMATLTAVLYEAPRRPERAGGLGPVIMALLAKDPEERPSGSALSSMLEEVILGEHGTVKLTPAPTPNTVVLERPGDAAPVTQAAISSAGTRPMERREWVRPEPVIYRRHRRRRSWLPVAVAAVAIVLLAGLITALQLTRSEPRQAGTGQLQRAVPSPKAAVSAPRTALPSTAPPGSAVTAPPAAEEEEEAATPPPEEASGAWTAYTDPQVGYRIEYPSGWGVTSAGPTLTDFRDPNSGAKLRVGWTDEPGSSPVARWREYSKTFAAAHPGYREIAIRPTTYKGYKAATWEFTYPSGGVVLHAVDLGFVTGDYGYALLFQTREEDWARSQPLFAAFQRSFRVAR